MILYCILATIVLVGVTYTFIILFLKGASR